MKIYTYKLIKNDPEEGQVLNFLYIPEEGLIGYNNKNEVRYFTDDKKFLEVADFLIMGKCEGKFLGEVELPDGLIKLIFTQGRFVQQIDQVRLDFQKGAKLLVEKIQEYSDNKKSFSH